MDVEDELVAMLNERESSLQSREGQSAPKNHGAEPTSSPSTGRRPCFEEEHLKRGRVYALMTRRWRGV